MHSAFHALFHHCAGNFVRLVNIPIEVVIVRAATARANEFCKAVFAFFTREQTRIFELFTKLGSGDTFAHAAHFKLGIACKLLAGIQVAVGGDGKIFVAGPASRNAFGKTRPAFQVDVEMEEIEPVPFRVTL